MLLVVTLIVKFYLLLFNVFFSICALFKKLLCRLVYLVMLPFISARASFTLKLLLKRAMMKRLPRCVQTV